MSLNATPSKRNNVIVNLNTNVTQSKVFYIHFKSDG
jgi:hypothetical protein